MAKIMLVEDDTNLSEIYQARLTAEGYDIVSAHDGEEALALAAKEKPDLIVSDVMMPKISGFEMLDILRNTEGLKETKVIMLTALGQAEDKTRAEALAADRYLVKSQVTLEDIVKAAQELLNGNAAPTATAPVATDATPAPAPTPVAPAPMPVAAPTPMAVAAPPAPAPANPTAAADNKLVADAVEGLIEGVTGKPADTSVAPTPTPSAPAEATNDEPPKYYASDETDTNDTNSDEDKNSSGGSHKKVIKPISDDVVPTKPSLESLLADEERKNSDTAGAPAAPNAQAPNTPVTNVPHQPGHIITPSAAESLNNGSGIDPNSIAL